MRGSHISSKLPARPICYAQLISQVATLTRELETARTRLIEEEENAKHLAEELSTVRADAQQLRAELHEAHLRDPQPETTDNLAALQVRPFLLGHPSLVTTGN